MSAVSSSDAELRYRAAKALVEIHDPATADALARFVEGLATRYPPATPPGVGAPAREARPPQTANTGS